MVGQRARIDATGNTNSPDPIIVRGMEVSVGQDLTSPPKSFDGSGGAMNHSWTDAAGWATWEPAVQ